jgi:hypothetical protein
MILTTAETKVFENMYEKDATYFRDGQYYPIRTLTKASYWSV